jgi:hypothetical protein
MEPVVDRKDTPEAWWRRRLAGLEASLKLPADRPRGGPPAGARPRRLELVAGGPSGCLAALDLVAAHPSREVDRAVLLAGVAALCAHLTGRDDLALGTSVPGADGRSGLAVLRFRFTPGTSFGELLNQARELAREATDRGPVPPGLAAQGNGRHHPFTQVVVAVRWPGEAAPNAAALRLTADAPPFDLAWTLDRAADPATLVLEHDAGRFATSGRTFLGTLQEMLVTGLGDPAVPLDALGVGPVPVA